MPENEEELIQKDYERDLIYDRLDDVGVTNDFTKLKSAYKTRSKTGRGADEIFEDKMWTFLFELDEFIYLNDKRECRIEFNGNFKKVDIVAESKLCKLFIECTTDNSINKVNSTIYKFREYKQLLSLPKNRADKINIAQVYFVKGDVSSTARKKLSDDDIFLITENALEYFNTLSGEYKKLCYYQFLNMIFGGKEIKALKSDYENGKFQTKALKAKDKLGEYYIFSVKPKSLLPISTVPHRKMSSIDDGLSQSYQRLISNKKIKGIQDFIVNDSQFPTNLILNFNMSSEVKWNGNNSFGTLSFTPRWGFINVIDGQHRLFSYMDQPLEQTNFDNNKLILEKRSRNHFLTVTAYVDLDIQKQIETFVTINEKQTPVSKNLLWDLYPELYNRNHSEYYKVKISKFCKEVNLDQDSPLYFKVKYPSAPYGSKSGPIDLNAFCSSLNQSKLIANKENSGLISSYFTSCEISEAEDEAYKFIVNFFKISRSTSINNDWDSHKFYDTNQYIQSFILLLLSIFKHFKQKNYINEQNKLDNIDEKLSEYIKPAIDFIDNLTNDELLQLKKGSYGAGGPKSIWQNLIREINRFYHEFESDEVLNIENSQEFNSIIDDLRNDGESDILEAKASMFKVYGSSENIPADAQNKILATICAMSNGKGGKLILGIGDPQNYGGEWEELGLDNSDMQNTRDNLMDHYRNKVKQKITSSFGGRLLANEIRPIKINNKHFCIIEIKKIPLDKLKPDYIPQSFQNKVYIRDGDSTSVLMEGQRIDWRDRMVREMYPDN